jgi:hypothetical protein
MRKAILESDFGVYGQMSCLAGWTMFLHATASGQP